MNRNEQHEAAYAFLKDCEAKPLPFTYTDMDNYENPLRYIAGDGGGLHPEQLNVCIDSQSELKQRFLAVKFPELTNCTILWYRRGCPDEYDWYMIGRYNYQTYDGRNVSCYFFMSAWCDTTGFDCQGDITFHLSHTLEGLCTYGITDTIRQLVMDSRSEEERVLSA